MTAKAVTISSDRFQSSNFASDLQHPTNPLRPSFNNLHIRQRIFVFLIAVAGIVGAVIVLSHLSLRNKTNEHLNATNSSSTTTTAGQQSLIGTGRQSMTSDKSNSNASTGTSSSSNSTSVTVNGQSVAVPQSGSYDKTMKVSGSNVHISGNSSQSTSSGSTTNSSSTNVEINSE